MFLISLKREMRLALILIACSQEHTERAFHEHQAILGALKARDSEQTEEAMSAERLQTTRLAGVVLKRKGGI